MEAKKVKPVKIIRLNICTFEWQEKKKKIISSTAKFAWILPDILTSVKRFLFN